jgi:signal recognition particle subunit SRP54
MGNMKDLMGMIPGVGKMMKNVEVDDDAFKNIESIIQSMTPFEKENPDSINQSRRTRIAKGSGTDLQEVNRLIKQFEDMRKVMKQMSNPAAMASMMKRMPR